MHEKDILIGLILSLISLTGLTLAIWSGIHQISEGNKNILQRTLLSGLGFGIFIMVGVIAMDYLGSPNMEKNWNKETLGSLLCIAFPIITLTTIGIFVWFSRREPTQKFLSNRLDKIIEKSKKQK